MIFDYGLDVDKKRINVRWSAKTSSAPGRMHNLQIAVSCVPFPNSDIAAGPAAGVVAIRRQSVDLPRSARIFQRLPQVHDRIARQQNSTTTDQGSVMKERRQERRDARVRQTVRSCRTGARKDVRKSRHRGLPSGAVRSDPYAELWWQIRGGPPEASRAHIQFMKDLNRDLTQSGELLDAQGLTPPGQARW